MARFSAVSATTAALSTVILTVASSLAADVTPDRLSQS
jgi:hypothetical protein